jgi:hypothetical protein
MNDCHQLEFRSFYNYVMRFYFLIFFPKHVNLTGSFFILIFTLLAILLKRKHPCPPGLKKELLLLLIYFNYQM